MNNDFKSYFVVVCTIIVIPVVLFMILGSHITSIFPESPWAYALQYNTQSEYVVIDPKPHDCEFDKAPIGNKYCRFEKTVTTERKATAGWVFHTVVNVTWHKVSE